MLVNSRYRLRDQSGIVLVVGLLLLLISTILGIAAIGTSSFEICLSGNQRASEEAFYAAEAGVWDATDRLKTKAISDVGDENNTAWNSGGSTTGYNNTFTVTHLVVGSPPAVGKTSKGMTYYLIRSTGTAGTAQRKLEALVSIEPLTPLGMCGCDNIQAQGPVDSYDSRSGTYASQATHTDAEGKLYANQNAAVYTTNASGNITLTGSVHGDVSATGTASVGQVYGTVTNGASPSQCDPLGVAALVGNADPSPGVTPPDFNNSPLVLDGSSGVLNFNDFNVTGGNDVTLTGSGPVTLYIEGRLSMSGGSTLTISPGIKLTMYVKGEFTISGGGIVNLSADPNALTVYTTAGTVTYSGGSTFYGLLYAPLSDVTLSGGSDFFGAVRGKTIKQSPASATFHYDESLGGGSLKGYKVAYWRQARGL